MEKKTLTAMIEFTLQKATGPNPDKHLFEVLDYTGDRLAYVSSVDEAADSIRSLIDPDNLSNVEVI